MATSLLLPRVPQPRRKPPPGTALNRGHPLNEALYAFWPLNEGGGPAIYDAVGHRAGAFVGPSAPTWGAGKQGVGLVCPGSATAAQNAVNLGPLVPGVAGMSIVAWVKTTASAGTGVFYHILSADSGSSPRWWQFRMRGDGIVQFVPFNSSNTATTVATTATINDGRWHQVAATWVAPGAVLVYIDAAQAGAGSLGGTLATTATHNAYLGGTLVSSGTSTESWPGGIDHALLANRALTATEVAGLYAAPFQMFERPRAYWAMTPAAGGGTGHTIVEGSVVSILGSPTRQVKRVLSSSIAAVGTVVRSARRTIASLVSSSSLVTRKVARPLLSAIGSVGVRSVTTKKLLQGTVSSFATIARLTQRIAASVVGLVGSLTTPASKIIQLASSIASSGAVARGIGRALSSTTVAGGQVARSMTRALQSVTSSAGQVVRRLSRAVQSSASSSGAYSTRSVVLLVFSSAVSATVILGRTVGRVATSAVAGVTTLTRTTSLAVQSIVPTLGAVARRLGRTIRSAISNQSAILRAIARALSGSMQPTGTVSRLVQLVRASVQTVGSSVQRTTSAFWGSVQAATSVFSSPQATVSIIVGRVFSNTVRFTHWVSRSRVVTWIARSRRSDE